MSSKLSHIFNNIILASCSYIIKPSPKLDMAVIWVDIWNFQNSTNTKMLINRYFNIRSHITMICSINMNPGISQYKNCWRWRYIIFVCHIHSTKCPKCNRLYKLEHYRDMAWCCKTNFKTNSPRLESPRDEPYLHMFKYANCKGNYQADSYNYSF